MSEPLVTQAQLEGLLRRLRRLEDRVGRTEVRESGQITGSFTPTWVGAGTAGTFTYTANACLVEWTLDGNRLFYNGRIVITAITVAPTGALSIAGWPYPGVANATMAIAGGGAMIAWAINVAAGYTDVNLNFTNGSSLAAVVRSGDNVAIGGVQGGGVNHRRLPLCRGLPHWLMSIFRRKSMTPWPRTASRAKPPTSLAQARRICSF